jgi:hypothetical protein
MSVIGVPIMKPTWLVSRVLSGTAEPQIGAAGGAVVATASQSGSTSYTLTAGGSVVTVTIGEVHPKSHQYNRGIVSNIGSSVANGIANAFVMIPHHGADLMTIWNRDFDKIASDLNKVIVRADERAGKQHR